MLLDQCCSDSLGDSDGKLLGCNWQRHSENVKFKTNDKKSRMLNFKNTPQSTLI